MAALFKYFVGVAVILPAVMFISAMTISEIFVGFVAVAQAPVTETPRKKMLKIMSLTVLYLLYIMRFQ